MIDYELFKTILTNEDEGYIENGDFINNDLLILLASSKVEKVKSLFKKGDVSLYDVEFNCEKCGKTFVLGVTKTKLYEQNNMVFMEVELTNQNAYVASKKLVIDKANGIIKKLVVQDKNEKKIVYILYNEIIINSVNKEDILAFHLQDFNVAQY